MTQALAIEMSRAVPRPTFALSRADVGAMAALLVLGTVVRFPWLWSIPQFTDETLDTVRSLALYQGKSFPLTAASEYVGAFHQYLEALAFWVFGPSIYVPRLLVCVLGIAAVPAAYWLAREMLGSGAARLAAALLATSGVHIAASSHIAWPLSLSPLLVALWLACTVRAAQRGSGASLAASAAFFGLALQVQLTVLTLVPGVAIYIVWRGRSLLRLRWIALAVGAFLIAYSNMVVYNVTTGLDSLKSALSRNASYEDYQDEDSSAYLARQGRILLTLARMPSSALDTRETATDYLLDPVLLLYAGLSILGIGLLTAKGHTLPLLVVLSTLLMLPLLGARHDLLPRQGRYLAPILPLVYACLAAGAMWLARATSSRLSQRGVGRLALATLGATAAVMLMLLPLVPLHRYYTESAARGETNDRFFVLLDEIEAIRTRQEEVLLDFQLSQEKLGGGGTTLRVLEYMLAMRGVPHRDLTLIPDRVARRYPDGGLVVVMSARTYRNVGAQLSLQHVDGRPATTAPERYGVYRLGPATLVGDASRAPS